MRTEPHPTRARRFAKFRRARWPATLAVFLALSGTAWAKPIRCSVSVIRDVGAEEAPDSVMHRGERDFGPITQVRVNKKTGRMTYCAHGSFCYAASAFDFTSPCRLEPDSFDDPDDYYFEPK